jgi:hypothetical protein
MKYVSLEKAKTMADATTMIARVGNTISRFQLR